MANESDLNDFDDLRKKVQNVNVPGEVNLEKLFPVGFMAEYTDYEIIEDFLKEGNLDSGEEDLSERLLRDDWDEFVRENSVFSSWKEMLAKGGEIWMERKLSDG